ncbi:restriction system protein [Butyrivibrio hungatei]|uniref:Restriction system protein n=1 Tax=Butyrivibrio hungatei TaxID=185008 RepID=A0A1G5BDE7_9FIRM|nr:restriction endonuclease [Butyrivibrio hungatei]SCX88060.1 restriction system protein [Butyrivibrio hungatei]
MKKRTICDAIKEVLKDEKNGLTYKEIFRRIEERKLYEFGAKSPQGVVHLEIRRHCTDLFFPNASPIKCFKIARIEDKTYYYTLADESDISESKEADESNSIQYVIDIEDELLPEEKMVQAYQRYLSDLKHSLLEKVRECHPSFFEKLVVDLLLAMGYGCDDKSGQVIGKSHDGGIDGIIREDKLGLNLIYIQAKRYNEGNSVGRPEIQRFIGAMQKAEKGVFITTSRFTKEALDFANAETRKHIRLIDGDSLVELMIKNSVGLERIKEYIVFKIDEDYFEDTN